MRIPRDTKRFRKDYKRLKKSGGKNMQKLHDVMDLLIGGEVLDETYSDHQLHGEWAGLRDCHIEGDWILLYKIQPAKNGDEFITFYATDNHSNLF